ncbi:BglG family transcription antiterminator [Bacillus sp. 1P06AnD]|uniref:BglG family transcription antiterminator n=1 Tax=Bacillus sp. 1P06AnD TaxID=3132208 RepID=UPI0039A3431C
MMVYVNQRELDIVKLLIDNDRQDFISSKQIAEQLNVSERTVQRELKNVEGTLGRFHIPLDKKAGKGVMIANVHAREIELLKKALLGSLQAEFTVQEKEDMLLWVLLNDSEPIKVSALASLLDSSSFVTNQVLAAGEEKLPDLHLQLIRKRGYGIDIHGNERDKRRAIMSLFTSSIDEYVFYEWLYKGDYSHLMLSRKQSTMLNTINHTIARAVKEYFDKEEMKLKQHMTGESYYRLLMTMIFSMERCSKRLFVDDFHVKRGKMYGTQEIENAHRIYSYLHSLLDIEFNENELHYMANKLKHMKYRTSEGLAIEENIELNMQIRQLITNVFKQMDMPKPDDKTFEMELLIHLQPSMHTLQSNGMIENQLLDTIKKEYRQLFTIIREEADAIWDGLKIPDEEIGYLVLHFGSYLLKHQSVRTIHVLIVCTHGIGSSKMLATTLKSRFPAMKKIDTVSLFHFESIDLSSYDLILSTIPLEVGSHKIIQVKSLLTNTDFEKIDAFLNEQAVRTNESMETDPPASHIVSNELKHFTDMQRRMTVFSSILDRYTVLSLPDIEDKKNMMEPLRAICTLLFKEGLITDCEAVIEKIEEREKMGKIAIPASDIAFFHARDHHVRKPFFKQFTLHNPIPYEATDGTEIQVKNIIILMAPMEMDQYERECLSTTSASLIESADSIRLFSSASEKGIKDFLATTYKKFILNEEV